MSETIFKKANRAEAYLKLGATAPSGAGKTYSALLLAKGLCDGDLSKAVVIDTENGSGNMYADLGDYSVVPFAPPYHPHRFVKIIQMSVDAGFKCIILDSISHEWAGPGGCLDLHEKFGGKYQDWAKVTPLHQEFIDAILQAKAHIICTMRRKQEYGMIEKGGRMVVEKMGLKEIQRDGFEFELSVNFDINMQHLAMASKDRTGLFKNNLPFMISEDTGKMLREWNMGTKKVDEKPKQLKNHAPGAQGVTV